MPANKFAVTVLVTLTLVVNAEVSWSDATEKYREFIFDTGKLKPIDSELKVKVGDTAPDFTLPSIQGEKITLSQFRGEKNVVLSFVPAAWTPICSDQWPGYVFSRQIFQGNDAILLGITVDNIPTLHAWTRQMGDIWFPVLSDFWPHGSVALTYGVLRSNGTAERALIIIDKQGIISDVRVNDINFRPPLDFIVESLTRLSNR